MSSIRCAHSRHRLSKTFAKGISNYEESRHHYYRSVEHLINYAVLGGCPAPYSIWKSGVALAKAEDLPEIRNVDFHVIKKWDKKSDGYKFLHGVGLAQHKGKLYASFAHNKGAENTVSEEAHYRIRFGRKLEHGRIRKKMKPIWLRRFRYPINQNKKN